MGIKIITQTNEQECGVCALTSLHNHFYNDELSKEQALHESNISDNGMSIFDLETLGTKLGLECESYEVKYSEFLSLKINNFFILLLSTGLNSNHFVIARKKKKYVEIYDSCSSEMKKVAYSEIKKMYLDIVVLVKKQPNKLYKKVFGKTSTLLLFDLKFVLLNLLLSVVILGVSIASASFLNYIIDLAIDKSSINNLITICFIFILFYFVNDIFSYVSNLYMSKHIKSYFMLFNSKILSSLEHKQLNFLNKVDKTWIYKVDECVYSISNFTIVEINKFITNIIFCFVCVCVIGCIQYWLLIFILAYALLEFIFFLFAYRKKKEVYLEIVRSENANANIYKKLIDSLSNEVWANKRHHIINDIKSNYSNIYKNYSDVILFKSNSTLSKSILKSFLEVVLIAFMAYLIIKTNELSVGRLTFLISAFGLFKSSTDNLFNYPLVKLEFDIYWQVYKDLTTVSNVVKSETFKIDEQIKTIVFCYKNNKIEVKHNTAINQLPAPVIELIRENEKIQINSQEYHLDQQLLDQIIVLNEYSNIDLTMLIEQIEKTPTAYAQYIQYFKLNVNNQNPGFYDRIIINLLNLLSEKDKIIFIDNLRDFIKKDDELIVKQIINKVKKHNSVFVTERKEND